MAAGGPGNKQVPLGHFPLSVFFNQQNKWFSLNSNKITAISYCLTSMLLDPCIYINSLNFHNEPIK